MCSLFTVSCQTLAEIPEEHVKEGDVDWLMAAAMLLDLTQHHLMVSNTKMSLMITCDLINR